MATSDGNVLYESLKGGNNRKERLHYGWYKLSPDGRVMGSGIANAIEDNVSPWSWFHTNNGGGGLIANIGPVDSIELIGGLKFQADEATLTGGWTAHVSGEKRVLIVGSDGGLEFESVVIERNIMPLREANAPQATTGAEMQSQMQAQQQWIDGLTTRYDANRSTKYVGVGPHRVEMVKPTDSGYAYLIEVRGNRKMQPPVNGTYVFEFDEKGETDRIRLEPLTEQLDIQLKIFAPALDGGFYLYGEGSGGADGHIIRIDRQGNPIARGHTTNGGGSTIEGIMPDENGAWLFGHRYENGTRTWVERFEF